MSNVVYGTLNDTEIIELGLSGKLITEDFRKENVKQACYELRAGNCYYDLNLGNEKKTVRDRGIILLKPHQRIVVITKEKLNLPSDILARILTKGVLFSVGISPVNTYADPGFVGRLGIVLQNTSNRYLKIRSGEAIAKIEFNRLQNPVTEVYHGQHGYETEIWPIKTDYFVKDSKELKKYLPDQNELDEINDAFGPSVATIIERVLVTERRFLISTVIFIIINLLIVGFAQGTDWLSPMMSVFLGVASNLFYTIISFIISIYRRKKR